jgi:hypothetical protein
MARDIGVIWLSEKQKYFFLDGLDRAKVRGVGDLPVGQKSHDGFRLNRTTREFGHLAPLAGRGRRSPGDAKHRPASAG